MPTDPPADFAGLADSFVMLYLPESEREKYRAALRQAEEMRKAIIAHRSQKADDRCIEDDDRLYEVLGDGIKCDRRVGSHQEMLANCRRFIENRCERGGWKSYVELEADLAAAREERERLKAELDDTLSFDAVTAKRTPATEQEPGTKGETP